MISRTSTQFESLEPRQLMAASATLSGDVLRVNGTSEADRVVVEAVTRNISTNPSIITLRKQYHVKITDAKGIVRLDSRRVPVDRYVDLASVNLIEINTFEGDDVVNTTTTIDDNRIFAGAGDDIVKTGSGDDEVYGEADADALHGNGGDDELYGGTEEDFLSGGTGVDTLLGRDKAFAQGSGGEGGAEYDRFQDVFDPNSWVVNGVSYFDVDQTRPPVCNVLSSLAAVARNTNNLASRIRYLGNSQYEVRLFGGASEKRETVTFDGTWSANDAAPTRQRDEVGRPTGAVQNEFWALLYQRAYLQHRGVDWTLANIADWGFEANNADAMRAISGLTRTSHYFSDGITASQVNGWLENGDALIALFNDHRFAILDMWQESGEWKIRIYNPRALDNAIWADARNDGEMVLSWTTFASNFTHISRGVRSDPL